MKSKLITLACMALFVIGCKDKEHPNLRTSKNADTKHLEMTISPDEPRKKTEEQNAIADEKQTVISIQEVNGEAMPSPPPPVVMDETVAPPPPFNERPGTEFNTEEYASIVENTFKKVTAAPLSTFSIDVDEAAYSNVRRFLQAGQLPPAGAVRIEEMINYFDYTYPQPEAGKPFSINTEMADCPWAPDHKLVHIGLQGRSDSYTNLPPSNFVFLVDVSGSMEAPDKLSLVKASLKMLTEKLRPEDRVALVVYAGNAGLVLPSTKGNNKTIIRTAIEHLEAGGSTAGGEGIELAYKTAMENFNPAGNNRIILATDGDFNVGPSSDDELVRLIEEKRKSGIYLSVLGFGMGNYKDSKMQQLADKGNGNHSYIDNINEARKVLVDELSSTLFTIAKDVKIQVEFNPALVQSYRLVGYENRALANEDFNDDTKDAGELGSGHTVTALYEIIPAGVQDTFSGSTDALKYQQPATTIPGNTGEWMTIKLRYKDPDADQSKLLVHTVNSNTSFFSGSSDNFRFAAAVAEFGMLLRNSAFRQASAYEQVLQLARSARGRDEFGYRTEFIQLVETASVLGKTAKK